MRANDIPDMIVPTVALFPFVLARFTALDFDRARVSIEPVLPGEFSVGEQCTVLRGLRKAATRTAWLS